VSYVLLVAVSLMAEETVETPQPTYPAQALEVVRQTNAYRAQHGLPALEIDPTLMQCAQAWSYEMTRSGFRHSRGGSAYRPSNASENIAMGSYNATATMRQWIGSGGHRANMLGSHSKIGVGCYKNCWTQQFSGAGRGATVVYTGGQRSTYSRRRGLFRRRR